jgi:hypothetical protein
MKQTAITLAALLIFTFIQISTSFCQKNYLPGQVVTNEGDTISGYIDYQHWSRSPVSIIFSDEENGTPVKYDPKDIYSFLVANDFYESRDILVSESPRTPDKITYNTEHPSAPVLAYLLVLVSGEISLYQYIDEMGKDHYYIESATYPIMELTYFKYFVKDHGKSGIAESTKFRGQLIAYMSDYPELHNKISKTNYNSEDLSKIVIDYNKHSSNEAFYIHKIDKAHYSFGVLGGVSITRLYYGRNSFSQDFEYTYYPLLGVYIILEPERGRGKWTIYTDLNYTGFDNKTDYTVYKDENRIDSYNKRYNVTYLKLAIMGRFNFIGHKIIPYIGAGGFFGKSILNRSQFNLEKYWYGTTTYTSYPIDSRDFDYGLSLGIGAKYKKFSMDSRYEFGGIAPYNGASTANCIYITFGYTFN